MVVCRCCCLVLFFLSLSLSLFTSTYSSSTTNSTSISISSVVTSVRRTCPLVLFPSSLPSSSRIIGAVPAFPLVRSVLVYLSHPRNSFSCTATLISSLWLLTAAHCNVTTDWVARISIQSYFKQPPSTSTTSNSTTTYAIQSISVHPSYAHPSSARLDVPGDLALIRLATPYIQAPPLLLNTLRRFPPPGTFATNAGYGRTKRDVPAFPVAANQVDLPVNHPTKCASIFYPRHSVSPPSFVCAGYDEARCKAHSCNGDSGGPLLQFSSTSPRIPLLIGVSSFGFNCGASSVPSVYVRVSAFVPWIKRVTQGGFTLSFLDDSNIQGFGIQLVMADGSDIASNPDTNISLPVVVPNSPRPHASPSNNPQTQGVEDGTQETDGEQLSNNNDDNNEDDDEESSRSDIVISKEVFAVLTSLAFVAFFAIVILSYVSVRNHSRLNKHTNNHDNDNNSTQTQHIDTNEGEGEGTGADSSFNATFHNSIMVEEDMQLSLPMVSMERRNGDIANINNYDEKQLEQNNNNNNNNNSAMTPTSPPSSSSSSRHRHRQHTFHSPSSSTLQTPRFPAAALVAVDNHSHDSSDDEHINHAALHRPPSLR